MPREKPPKMKRTARQPKSQIESVIGAEHLDGEEMVSQLDRLFAIERLKEGETKDRERALEKEWKAAHPAPLSPPRDPLKAAPPPPQVKPATPPKRQAPLPPPRVAREPVASSEHQWDDEPTLAPKATDLLGDIQEIQDTVWAEVEEAPRIVVPSVAKVEPEPVAALEDELGDGPAVIADEPPPPVQRPQAAVPRLEVKAPASKPISMQARLPWVLPLAANIFTAGLPPEADEEELSTTARLIESTMGQHGVEVSVAEIRPGPSVTMFGLVPGWRRTGRAQEGNPQRVRVDSILAREKDLALALAAPSLRIEAPVPGESVVGVEVPNKSASVVSIRSIMESTAYTETLQRGGLSVALGQGSVGEAMALDLLRMPHLLIAGATGSGKSVCIHSIIGSIITHQQPSEVRLVLIDPKRVELTPYNGIPHLATPVVVEVDKTVRLLKAAVQEMLRRYQLLEEIGVRNLQSYNRSPKAKEPISYLVICIDELADLMMASSYEIERNICRLAQLGRATGIHLVVATQRPSVDVVTGLIKANFPSRISFAVASQTDSRTILDTGGAERLLGRGDMLFVSAEAAKPRRVQGAYITEEETEILADFWRNQQGPPLPEIPLEAYIREAEEAEAAVRNSDSKASDAPQDALFQKATDIATRNNQLSTSLLQRRLRIGYPRAARLMDELEDAGIVGPGESGRPREVLYRRDDLEEEP
jgi:S-DNA-T family DNA segregation ATPase FtsK/SpoIIIE